LNSTNQLQFGDSGTYINQSSDGVLSLNSDNEINLAATGDITLNSNGADVILKDDTTTYGSLTNNTGNLIIKSGTTTALTFSGADVTVAGSLTIGSAVINESDLEQLDDITAGTASASKAVILDASRSIVNLGSIGCSSLRSSGSIYPENADGASLGTSSYEWSDLFLADGAVINLGNDQEVTLTHVADTGILLNGTNEFQFGSSSTKIHQSTSGQLDLTGTTVAISGAATFSSTITSTGAILPSSSDQAALGSAAKEWSDLFLADGAVINLGNDQEVTLTHVADTGILLNSTNQLQFGDSGTYINQSSDGVLSLNSDNEINLAATGDITLNSNGADVILKDDTTTYGSLTNNSGNLIIKSGTTTALTFSGANVTVAGSLSLGNAVINESDLEQLDDITAGTASASKAVILDASKSIVDLGSVGCSSLRSSGSIYPENADGASLGTSSYEWSDLFLADGAVINLGNDQEVTLTHVADTGIILNGTNEFQFGSSSTKIHQSTSGQLDLTGTTVAISGAATFSSTITSAGNILPSSSDGAALGSATKEWSDLFLADGAVINLGNEQEVTLTHVADTGILLNSTNQLQFGDSGTYINQSSDGVLSLNSDNSINLDATGDITLDAGGADVILKDDGTTYGSLTNNSGNLKIKSGTTDALTFTGANLNVAGTLQCATSFTIGSAVISESDLEKIDDITNGVAYANKAVVLGTSKEIATIGTIGCGAITSTGDSSFEQITVDSVVINDKSITMTGSTDDTATITVGTDGTLSITTVDTNASAANISITADGTNTIAGTSVVIDSAGDIELNSDGADIVLKDDSTTFGTFTNNSGNLIIKSGTTTALTFSGANVTVAGSLSIGSAAINEADLEQLDDITAGTASASKAVVLDSSRSIVNLGSVGCSSLRSSGSIYPENADGASLGTSGNEWSDLYLADSSVIYLGNDQDVTISHISDTGIALEATSDSTNSVKELMNLTHTTTGTPAAGIGTDIAFTVETSSNNNEKGMILETVTTDVTSGQEDFDFVVKLMENGSSAAEKLRLTSAGNLTISGAMLPSSANGAAIGSATKEWSDLFLADGAVINLGNNQDVTLTHVADTGILLNGTKEFQFGSSSTKIHQSTSGQLDLTGTTIAVSGAATFSSTITSTGSILPNSSDGAALGSITKEWSDLFLADGAVINLGNDQEVTLTHVADTGILLNSTNQLQFGDSGTYINQSSDGVLALNSDDGINLAATGDITLNANGADILLKDDTTSFGSFTNNSGNLKIKSGSTEALSFSGANLTVIGTLACSTSLTIGSAIMSEADLEQLDDLTAGTATASKALVVDSSRSIVNLGSVGCSSLSSSGSIYPENADGASLGTSGNEWSDIYLADSSVIYLGSDQEVTISHVTDTGIIMETTSNSTNSIKELLNLTHTTSGTPSVGIGTDIAFTVETSSNNNEKGMILETITTDVTEASENFDFVVKLMEDGSSAAERMKLTSDGHLSVGDHNTGANAGSNWPGPTIPKYIGQIQGEYVMTLHVDLQGAESKEPEYDVIGSGSSSSVYISKCSTSYVGFVYKAEMMCIEAPTGGDADIDLNTNTSDLATDTDVRQGTSVELINAGGSWAVGMRKISTAGLTMTDGLHDHYLYLSSGNGTAGTAGTYTAGKFVIKLYGAKF
jgi:hypothetical protein